jgi:hypothetical protein
MIFLTWNGIMKEWLWACPFGSGYPLQVLARIMLAHSLLPEGSLWAFRSYPSRKEQLFYRFDFKLKK